MTDSTILHPEGLEQRYERYAVNLSIETIQSWISEASFWFVEEMNAPSLSYIQTVHPQLELALGSIFI